jgi:hypothetical protein
MTIERTEGSAEKSGALCYFLVCFSSAEFVSFLLSSLFRPQDAFFIHCDKKAPAELKLFLEELRRTHNNIFLLPSEYYSWAGFSHVAVSLKAIAAALELRHPWQHFIFLSEQHLPLKSPEQIIAHLQSRKTMVALRAASTMGGVEWADMLNRFGANYRELAGVGCFATALVERDKVFFEQIFHGSNWIVVHRDHCRVLIEGEKTGRFDMFRNVVHAEETAMQSMLAPLGSEIELVDPTLVAWPWMTDNHSLVMTEELFKSAIDTDHLFIRKRPNALSDFVREFVMQNHFYDLGSPANSLDAGDHSAKGAKTDSYIATLLKGLRRSLPAPADLEKAFRAGLPKSVDIVRIGPMALTPQFHLELRTPSLKEGLSVRVISENLSDFKVFIAKIPKNPGGPFEPPYVSAGRLYSTLRVRVLHVFGYQEILPLDIEGAGFLSLAPGSRVDAVVGLASRFLHEAASLP